MIEVLTADEFRVRRREKLLGFDIYSAEFYPADLVDFARRAKLD